MANALTRLLSSWKTKAAVGSAYWLPVTGAWLPADIGSYMNWWQMGDVTPASSCSAILEACISAYSQTIAQCPGDHWRLNAQGGRDRITNSALSRILRKPNTYQSISDFMLNATRSLYLDGNAYALALRNDRFEISELHLMNPRQSAAQIAVNGEVFYALGGNEIIDRRIEGPLVVPSRDVLHIRLHTTRNMLKGESPLVSAAYDLAAGNVMMQQQIAFYTNQARPSTVLVTDQVLKQEQIEYLRDKWDQQSKGLAAGGTVILSQGTKPFPLTVTAKDAELAEMMKMSEQHVALAFRIPLQLLGIGETPFASTEALMQFWLASGLGFALNHVEEAFGQVFQLKGVPEEYVEFSTTALLRSAEKDRMDALARSIKGGIRTINEARATEMLPRVEGGDDIRCQQQDVPLDWWEQQAEQQAAAAAAPPAPEPAPPSDDEDQADDNERNQRILHHFRSAQGRALTL